MKRIYFLFLIIPAFIFSCDKIEDATTKDFNATLSMDIPVTVVAPAAINLKSTVADHSFSQSGTASLKDIDEVSDYLKYLESIDINNLKVVFSGLQAGQEVKTISISVTSVGVIATITNISSSNASHTPAINAAKLVEVASKLKSSKEIDVTVSGITNEAPMAFNVNIDWSLKVTASLF